MGGLRTVNENERFWTKLLLRFVNQSVAEYEPATRLLELALRLTVTVMVGELVSSEPLVREKREPIGNAADGPKQGIRLRIGQ